MRGADETQTEFPLFGVQSQERKKGKIPFITDGQLATMESLHGSALSPMRGRRRALAWVGFYLLSFPTAGASPLAQHHVGAAQREVPYSHTLERRTKTSFSAFRIPSDQQRRRERMESARMRRRLLHREHQDGDVLWHILVDASQDNPDELFHRLRHDDRRDELEAFRNPSWFGADWVQANDSIITPAVPTDGNFSQVPLDSPNFDQTNVNKTSPFNVSAITEYNVSANVLEGSGNETNDTSTVIYTTVDQNSANSNQSEGDDTNFYPLRIRAFLSEVAGGGQHLTDNERTMLLQNVVGPALLSWSAALRVDPVVGNLTVDPSQLIDGQMCGPGADSGLPSVTVPSYHITEGIPDTDLIIYLSLSFANSTDSPYQSDETGAPIFFNLSNFSMIPLSNPSDLPSSTPSAHPSANVSSTAPTLRPTTTGGPTMNKSIPPTADLTQNANDLLFNESMLVNQTKGRNESLYFNSSTTRSNESNTSESRVLESCPGDFLAAAAFCSTDQYDRPVAAVLHLCIGDTFFDQESLQANILLVMHELGHALGFNSISLAHFRRPDGSPITPRVNGTIPLKEVECTGPSQSRVRANISLPSEEIVQFRTVRGGIRVAVVVTPSVAQVARNHFGCQELAGAELETGVFLPLATNSDHASCIGDHWERRLFQSDLMNPLVEGLDFTPRISTITLAYFADSGWYQVDLSRASFAAGWGRAAGCSFVDQPCITSKGQVPTFLQAFFCNEAPERLQAGFVTDIHGCTPDLSRKAVCALGRYDVDLPLEYQYFNQTYGSDVGGSDPYMDFCPVYAGFSNGLCSDARNDPIMRVNAIEDFGQKNSRCLNGIEGTQPVALCLPIACVVEDSSLRIQIDGIWQLCTSEAQQLTSKSGVVVICPDPIRICPTFYCQRDCLGTNLQCNFTVGQCICNDKSCMPPSVVQGNSTSSQKPTSTFEDNQPLFYNPVTSDANIPDADSPLSDYYVTSERVLQNNDSHHNFRDKGTTAAFIVCIVTLAGVLLVLAKARQRYRFSEQEDDRPNLDPDNDREVSPNANKDKMIATVVVDIRMNDPNLHDRSSETDLSMTDTDGSGTIANLSSDVMIESDLDSVIDMSMDPLAPPCCVRRRHKSNHFGDEFRL